MASVGDHFAFVRAYETCRVVQNYTEPPDKSCTYMYLGFQSTSTPFPGQNVLPSEGSNLAEFCSKTPSPSPEGPRSVQCAHRHRCLLTGALLWARRPSLGDGVGGGGGGAAVFGRVGRHVVARAPQPCPSPPRWHRRRPPPVTSVARVAAVAVPTAASQPLGLTAAAVPTAASLAGSSRERCAGLPMLPSEPQRRPWGKERRWWWCWAVVYRCWQWR
jgi:hypothetical protein